MAGPEGDRARLAPGSGLPVAGLTALLGMLLSSVSGSSWLLLVAGAAVGVVVEALITTGLGLRDARVLVAPPPPTRAGESFQLALAVRNEGRRPVGPLRVGSSLSPGYAYLEAVPPGATAVFELAATAPHRGVHEGLSIALVATGALDVVRRSRAFTAVTPLVVRPALVAPARLSPPQPVPAPDGEAGTRTRAGDGLDVLGVREWRPGDETGRVHWRTTARRGAPVVLDREEPRLPGTLLCLAGDAPGQAWEDLVALTCATTVAAQARGERLRLVLLGTGGLQREAPTESVDALLDWWTEVMPAGLPTAAQVAGQARDGERLVVACACPHALDVSGRTWWSAVQAAGGPGVQLLQAAGPAGVGP